MRFKINTPDHEKSPYTGMTKRHWVDAAQFLLDGIFSNITDFDTPVYCPRTEFTVSYPNEGSPEWKKYAAGFEGLARSFLIAAPLLHNRPDAVTAGYSVKDYYREHILRAVTKGTGDYMLSYRELEAMSGEKEHCFQHTCECASLVIGLWQCKEIIWDTYTRQERDRIAGYLLEFGNARTVPHNWRLFNMLILGFLWSQGYEIDENKMRDHAQVILSYYAGDGWYRDGHRFDYYSPWAFHVYSAIWNVWYGYEKEPETAERFEAYSNSLLETYEGMFDRDAHVTMWGRSGIYRNAASAPFASVFFLRENRVEPGLARRINSGALLQFIENEKVFENGVPVLGFYGQFPPMLQDYSCAESPFWMANPFLCLNLPDAHPFWTETESNGDWETLSEDSYASYIMDGPGIAAFHQGANGAAEFCTAKNVFHPEDDYIKAYIRLAFHSRYPWEDFDYRGAEAMQYSLRYDREEQVQIPNIMLYAGEKDGVLYRQEYFGFRYNFQGLASMDLADIPLANGILHADRMRIHEKPFTLTVGAYGFPVEGKTVTERRTEENAEALIVKNQDRSLAFVSYWGFDSIERKERVGVNAVSKKSVLLYGRCRREEYYEYRPYMMIYAVLTVEGRDFTQEELFPIERIGFADAGKCGGTGPVEITLRSGRVLQVDYEGMEGRLRL